MDAIRRASAFLFYLFGVLLIVTVLLTRRGFVPSSLDAMVNSLDLPFLFIAMIFGGSSLYLSLTKGRKSMLLLVSIFLPLAALFGFFCYLNFVPPMAEAF